MENSFVMITDDGINQSISHSDLFFSSPNFVVHLLEKDTSTCFYCKKDVPLATFFSHQQECRLKTSNTSPGSPKTDPFSELNPFRKPEEKKSPGLI